MIAYTHLNEHDYLDIVYAVDEVELNAMQLDELKRAEWADRFAPDGPTDRDWLENGYTIGCYFCEHRLTRGEFCDECCDGCNDDHPVVNGIVFDAQGHAYCGEHCLDGQNRMEERNRKAKEDCKASFLKKFPYATVTDVWIGGPGQCDCFSKDNYNAALHWTIPGGKIKHGNSYCGGCKKAWVCNGDLEAFNKAKERDFQERCHEAAILDNIERNG